jgi:hypothetical protein
LATPLQPPLAARGDLAIRRPPHAAVAVEDAVRSHLSDYHDHLLRSAARR